MFQLDPQAITHNQHHKGEGNAGVYSRALQSVQPPTKRRSDCHQPFKRASEHPLVHWGVHLAAGGDGVDDNRRCAARRNGALGAPKPS